MSKTWLRCSVDWRGATAPRLASTAVVTLLVLATPACGAIPRTGPAAPAATVVPHSSMPVPPTETLPGMSSPTVSPQPPNTPTPDCADSVGRLVNDHYRGHNVQQDVPIIVYLPPCYEVVEGPLPVMYLLHGKPFTEEHWVDLGIVGAEEERLSLPDYSEWVLVMPRVPEPLFSSTDGGPGSYEDEFTLTVIPYVESTYTVRSDPGGRAIAGISRGGVWSLEIGLSHPELFSMVMALSPALAVNHPRPVYDPFTLVTSMSSLPGHIFLGAGDDDWAKPGTQKLLERLEARGTQPESAWVPGIHNAATWEALLPQMLRSADHWFTLEGVSP